MEVYDDIKTSVNMDCMKSDSFEVKAGVQQESILNPFCSRLHWMKRTEIFEKEW